MTGKTNGVDTWTYSWNDDENRLVRVQGPGGVDVSYSYDQMGRMLTRDDGELTQFYWDGFTCIREIRNGVDLIYHIPEGLLQSFSLNGAVYQVHMDALGSVRMITDDDGDVVARTEFDAFGKQISTAEEPFLADFSYRFAGGEGLRTDSAHGLIYVRQRWYSPQLQCFISRDPIGIKGGPNRYKYCGNDPVNNVDVDGRRFRKKKCKKVTLGKFDPQKGYAPLTEAEDCDCDSFLWYMDRYFRNGAKGHFTWDENGILTLPKDFKDTDDVSSRVFLNSVRMVGIPIG